MKKLNILKYDSWLSPHEWDLEYRMSLLQKTKSRLLGESGKLLDFANGHHYYGFHETKTGWVYREWSPNAEAMSLVGDFNDWREGNFELKKLEHGNWELEVQGELPIGSRIKVRVRANGQTFDRIPAYIQYAVQNKETKQFEGVIYRSTYKMKNVSPRLMEAPLIYETHIGISTEEYRINSYKEFTRDVLPRIKEEGYNIIQLMAIMEHPLYASFGYQVSNFYAASSRFGTPDDLKELIDTAHGLGLLVLLDVVHSHAVKNVGEGLNLFDGSEYQYFHAGEKGEHPAWNTKLFNYGKDEVLHFLLSNLKFWQEEYLFDGFRFDGVTSMLYHHHGLGTSFDSYNKYFSMDTDVEAVTYLQLANELVREVNPNAITIAEDMSAMPGMAMPISDGGIGFDYRLSMGVPDYWIKQLKEKSDDELNLHELWHELTTRRPHEKNIGYAESHDQALVGDKTLMFWLADAEMYTKMDIHSQSLVIDRAIAFHKLIRLITFSLAGEGYLNFMGNEFGHPEWLDFPRVENHDSYQHARRQWSLADNPELKFQYLLAFDKDMLLLEKTCHFMDEGNNFLEQKWIQQEEKLLAYQKGNLLFVFNFHSTNERFLELYYDLEQTPELLIDTDNGKYGGFGPRNHFEYDKTEKKLKIKLAPRTAFVFKV
ncbi:1,4-alpha-glucan branching enzyme [Pilibacter termitis]|uniref:1,4-alpha-glucan branching enzyme n=1 Tax=Pilibacter termitis TaxID=263852 RepID=A0A1T4QID1_9ENTE|nr:alpha-amylase family glycosyl hydrolase [Pilibacter termitis]SKA03397.1 1,4-alpha-glucan branching enzyme [Pilibacter termitis]